MKKLYNFRLETNLIKKIDQLKEGTRTDVLTNALQSYLQGKDNCNDDVNTDLYNEIYTSLYNMEIMPLKKEVGFLTEFVDVLKEDKKYLMSQNNALILTKMPLLGRLKLWLLRSKSND